MGCRIKWGENLTSRSVTSLQSCNSSENIPWSRGRPPLRVTPPENYTHLSGFTAVGPHQCGRTSAASSARRPLLIQALHRPHFHQQRSGRVELPEGEYWKPLSEVERTIQHDMATYNSLNPECGQRQCKSAHGRAIQ